MKSKTIKVTVILPATPHDVFEALTESRIIKRWSGQRGNVEPKIGGTMEMFDGWVKGKVLDYNPRRILSYSWKPQDWSDDVAESIVSYRLKKSAKGTTVELQHRGFPNDSEAQNHKDGWHEFVFDPLKEYFNTMKDEDHG